MSDQPDDPGVEVGGTRIGDAPGLDALEIAMREMIRSSRVDTPKATGTSPTRRSSDSPSKVTGGSESRGTSSDPKPANRGVRRARILWSVVVAGGTVVALLVIALVAYLVSSAGGNGDAVAQSCVVRDFGANATVVVTNHGNETASYTFDVVFSQGQSQAVSVPYRVTALPAGNSQTVDAYSGSLNAIGTPTCRITNLQRLPGR